MQVVERGASSVKPGTWARTTEGVPCLVEAVKDGAATVRIFDSPDLMGETADLGTDSLSQLRVAPRERVWFSENGRVRAGTVQQEEPTDGSRRYLINPLDGRCDAVSVAEQDLMILSRRRPIDPVPLLKQGVADHARFVHIRSDLLEINAALHSAVGGVTALLSSPIDYFDHQIGVVATVLSDPVQRYLLADEVGMGKTIEAALILRQWLIDSPNLRCVIAVPALLCNQWREELERTRVVQLAGPGQLSVCTHDDLSQGHGWEVPDAVIVDEAHRLTKDPDPSGLAADRCRSVERLLMLSATPVRSNERGFLDLLQLLDPGVYTTVSEEEFRRRIDDRQQVSNLVARLNPTAPAFLLKGSLASAKDLLPDPKFVKLADEALEALNTDELEQKGRSLTADLRSLVSDTYRVHRRLLRNRRSSVRDFAARGRTLQSTDVLRAPVGEAGIQEWLDRFAGQLGAASETVGEEVAIDAFRVVGERLSADASAHAALRQFVAGDHGVGNLPPSDAELLQSCRTDEAVAELLDSLLLVLDEPEAASRIDIALKFIEAHFEGHSGTFDEPDNIPADKRRWSEHWKPPKLEIGVHQKVVVFTSFPEVARAFQDAVRAREYSRRLRVQVVTAEMPPVDAVQAIDDFRLPNNCFALVGDDALSEGLNFQDCALCIHLDLPFDVNRIEQRIGRLDRRSLETHAPTRSVVFASAPMSITESEVDSVDATVSMPGSHSEISAVLDGGAEPTMADAWTFMLVTGVRVFHRSSATLQYATPDLERHFLRLLLAESVEDAVDAIPELAKRADVLRREILAQDDLDAVDFTVGDFASLAKDVEQAADSIDHYEGALSEAMTRMLGFKEQRRESGLRFIESQAGSMLDFSCVPGGKTVLEEPGFSNRNLALGHNGRLWAPGDPLVDAVAAQVSSGDRGVVGAHRIDNGTTPFFRFAMSLEASVDPNASSGLRHRTASVMLPLHRVEWVGPNGQRADDVMRRKFEDQLRAAEPSQADILFDLMGPEWRDLVQNAVDAAIEHAESDEETSKVKTRSLNRAREVAERHRTVRRLRQTGDGSEEEAMFERLLAVVGTARFRIDSACALFVPASIPVP